MVGVDSAGTAGVRDEEMVDNDDHGTPRPMDVGRDDHGVDEDEEDDFKEPATTVVSGKRSAADQEAPRTDDQQVARNVKAPKVDGAEEAARRADAVLPVLVTPVTTEYPLPEDAPAWFCRQPGYRARGKIPATTFWLEWNQVPKLVTVGCKVVMFVWLYSLLLAHRAGASI